MEPDFRTLPSFIDRAISNHIDQTALAEEPFEVRGIFHSEIAAAVGLVSELSCDVVIESGRARGQSTHLLGKFLPSARIISVELARDEDARFAEDRLSSLPNVELLYGDANAHLPELVRAHADRRIAILIDGPKGRKALRLLRRCFDASHAVKIGFIHDLSKDNSARYEAASHFADAFFTDDAGYVDRYRHLDRRVFDAEKNWTAPYINKGTARKSYGPTLGVFGARPPSKHVTHRLIRAFKRRLRWS